MHRISLIINIKVTYKMRKKKIGITPQFINKYYSNQLRFFPNKMLKEISIEYVLIKMNKVAQTHLDIKIMN